jgi:hypothetical protein
MTEWVRVRDKSTKHEYTVGVVDPEAHEVLDKEAVDSNGLPLPGKPYRSKIEPAASATKRTVETERSAS